MADLTLTELGVVSAGAHRLSVGALAADDPAAPVVIVLPAMGVPASYYRPFLQELHERGCAVVSVDTRGQGASTPAAHRGIRFGYQDLIEDAAAIVELVEREFPQAPRFLLGHSLGGQIAMLFAAAHPGRVRGVTLLASGSVWFRSFPGLQGWKNLVATQAVAALCTVLGHWPGERFGFGGRQPSGIMQDWARQGRTGRYRLGGSRFDYEKALRELNIPLLTVSVEGDELAPDSSVDHLAAKAVASPRTRRHYSCEVAGAPKLGHYAWVYNSGVLVDWITDWAATARKEATATDGDRR
ncbi:alpha/beta fold hydrolase [Saccharopolyspora gloriosae]|uniref:alpha/beta hydrolase family protein n=1 Tax=Saccharopolyspora gloriosae TaxID=455344 RepID=UPI001FB685B3|nr:alpha/beta fold hydrolase [Saccharopolyspora gloriosae]